jgi:hypothetical protein
LGALLKRFNTEPAYPIADKEEGGQRNSPIYNFYERKQYEGWSRE